MLWRKTEIEDWHHEREKVDLIIDTMNSHGVDVMATHETRLKKELQPAAQGWANRRGCSMVAEQCYISKAGTDEGGVCIISRLPVQQVQMSGRSIYEGRVVDAIHSNTVRPVADYDRGCRWPEVKEVDKHMEVFELWQHQFAEAVDQKDVEKAWEVLSRVKEATLTEGRSNVWATYLAVASDRVNKVHDAQQAWPSSGKDTCGRQ